MAPVRSYSSWNRRETDEVEKMEPYRKYFFVCEGANTETWYFQKLIDLRKELNIHPLIEVQLLEKTDEDRNISFPLKLIEFADKIKGEASISFDRKRDKMIVVFDADIFEDKVLNYEQVIAKGKDQNILGVTNPSFELFLLLHYENAVLEDIIPNYQAIVLNEKVGNKRYIYTLLHKKTGINSKTNPEIGELARQADIAISQESSVNQDIHNCRGVVTSNIGSIIRMIREDRT